MIVNTLAVIVVSKGKSLTWLDDCRIPYSSDADIESAKFGTKYGLLHYREECQKQGYDHLKKIPIESNPPNQKGRFPANLLVSDDVLNDGKITKSTGGIGTGHLGGNIYGNYKEIIRQGAGGYGDSGSYSRYFDLDRWYKEHKPKGKIKKKLVRPLCS